MHKTILKCKCIIRFPANYIYFHFEFSLVFRSYQLGGALANKIKHGDSPVFSVVSDPNMINQKSLLYMYNRSVALSQLEYSYNRPTDMVNGCLEIK